MGCRLCDPVISFGMALTWEDLTPEEQAVLTHATEFGEWDLWEFLGPSPWLTDGPLAPGGFRVLERPEVAQVVERLSQAGLIVVLARRMPGLSHEYTRVPQDELARLLTDWSSDDQIDDRIKVVATDAGHDAYDDYHL
jgi:hypothetical protein